MSEDSEDDREGDEDIGGGDKAAHKRKSTDETIIKSGYLWKKGERRKVRNDIMAAPPHLDILRVYI